MLGQRHDGVDAVEQVRVCGQLAGTRLAREDVVGGEHERPAGQQAHVDLREREPLQVNDVGGPGRAAVAEHAGHVRGQAAEAPQRAPPGRPDGAAVEALVEPVPVGERHLAVREGARDERDLGAGGGERRAQRVVVEAACRRAGRRRGRASARRRLGLLHLHAGDQLSVEAVYVRDAAMRCQPAVGSRTICRPPRRYGQSGRSVNTIGSSRRSRSPLAFPVLAYRLATADHRPPSRVGRSTSSVRGRQDGVDVARVEGVVGGADDRSLSTRTIARAPDNVARGVRRRAVLLHREHGAARAARALLDAVAAERDALPFASEVLVLDNASRDGSAGAARRHTAADTVIVNEERRGKGENDTALLRRARGRFCLLLNEDSELRPGAVAALHTALTERPKAAAAGLAAVRPDGSRQPSAWRFPSPRTALIGALFLHRRLTVQSSGDEIREVDWAQSAALLVDRRRRRDRLVRPAFFVYSDEVDFCKRLRAAGRDVLFVPEAVCVHHEQLSTGPVPERRIVELSRNRDRYMRKHHSAAAPAASAGSPRGRTASGRSRRSCSPATTRAATGAMCARRCGPSAARAARGGLRAQPRRPQALGGRRGSGVGWVYQGRGRRGGACPRPAPGTGPGELRGHMGRSPAQALSLGSLEARAPAPRPAARARSVQPASTPLAAPTARATFDRGGSGVAVEAELRVATPARPPESSAGAG